MKNKVIGIAVLTFVIYFIASRPREAGHVAKELFHDLRVLADAAIAVIERAIP